MGKTVKITKEWLDEKGACEEGRDWFVEQGITDPVKGIKNLIKHKKVDWANWLIIRVMTRPQRLAYVIFAAEQVIDIFEKKYPQDKRPRRAIEATKAVLENDTPETRDAAWAAGAAAEAAWAAVEAAGAAWAALAAGEAAGAAVEAAWAAVEAAGAAGAAWATLAAGEAAGAAVEAAGAAVEAAGAARATLAAGEAAGATGYAMKIKILKYGLSLLEGK